MKPRCSREISSIVVVANRVHPNWTPIDAALLSEGISVRYEVKTVGQAVNPALTHRTHVIRGWVSMVKSLRSFRDNQAGLLIIKDANVTSFVLAVGALVSGWRRMGFCQEPIVFDSEGLLRNARNLVRRTLVFLRLALASLSSDVVTVVPWRGKRPIKTTKMFRFVRFPGAPVATSRHKTVDSTLSVLCVGKFGLPRKRHDWIVEALREHTSPLRLDFVGTLRPPGKKGSTRAERNYKELLIRMRSLPSNVAWEIHQNVPFNSVKHFYEKASMFCLPAESEPFSYSVLEAMGAGLPVLISSDNGAAGYVVEEDSGLVFEAQSFDDFKAKLQSLLSSADLRHKLSTKALRRIDLGKEYRQFVRSLLHGSVWE